MAKSSLTSKGKHSQAKKKEVSEVSEPQTAYIADFISGEKVKATPEEIEAVQVFTKQLFEDYGYPKSLIQTHPQYRVKVRPSDTKKEYPVDIAVFKNEGKKDADVYIIVECKQKDRKDGRSQLEDYLRFCSAPLGVWFNGQQRLFLRKIEKGGKVLFDEIPNIPQNGQRLEDVGLFKRKDLKSTHNLKEIFKSIRNYLAGNAVGTTRDEELAKQLINIILCKLYDEKFTKPDDIVQFRAGVSESLEDISHRIKKRFSQAKEVYKDVLEESDSIDMDDKSIAVVVGELQNYGLLQTERDALGDAFEIFIGRALKGGQGQFFTPRNVVKTVIEIIDPKIEDRIIDPACGSGGFLVECLRHIHKKIESRGAEYNWPQTEIDAEKVAKINNNLRGIEKDKFLSKVAKAYMVILGDGKSGIFCQDSLDLPENWEEKTQASVQLGSFDIVITNPPFGAKIPVRGTEKLSQFPLGYKWEKNKEDYWIRGKVKESESPQILFIDRCYDLLKEGGRLGIVLPDGTLSNPTDGYIRQSLLERTEIIGLIDLPMTTFLPYTPTKTHLLFLRKKRMPAKDYEIFMSYAKTCGHDKRGRQVNEDEIRLIPEHLKKVERNSEYSHLGFKIRFSNIKNGILLPKYYNPDLEKEMLKYKQSARFKITTVADLVQQKIIKVMRGNEVGSENYGTGDIPFIRTSEVANWELIADCTQCLSEDIYNEYKNRQKIQEEDILVVNDGTYLMGRTAMITDLDFKIVYQSHFRKITVLKKEQLSPHLLLGLMGMEIVQKQIESKSFRQGTISTLGNRLLEVKIPIPIDEAEKRSIEKTVIEIIKSKRDAKEKAQNYKIMEKNENLMGMKNKAKLGNL